MISKNEKSQSINNNQIGVEFHERGNKTKLIIVITGQWSGRFVTKPMVDDTWDHGE